MYKVKILDHTPFNKEGDVLTIDEFRKIYGYIHIAGTSNMELIEFLKNERACYLDDIMHRQIEDKQRLLRSYTGYWFEVFEQVVPEFKIGNYIIQPVLSRQVDSSYFKNEGNVLDLIYLYVVGHGQYFSLKEIIDWFLHGKRFFTGFKAVKNIGACKDTATNCIVFTTPGVSPAFALGFQQALNKAESVISILEEYFYKAPKDSTVEISIGFVRIEFKEFCSIIRECYNISYKKKVVYELEIHKIE